MKQLLKSTSLGICCILGLRELTLPVSTIELKVVLILLSSCKNLIRNSAPKELIALLSFLKANKVFTIGGLSSSSNKALLLLDNLPSLSLGNMLNTSVNIFNTCRGLSQLTLVSLLLVSSDTFENNSN